MSVAGQASAQAAERRDAPSYDAQFLDVARHPSALSRMNRHDGVQALACPSPPEGCTPTRKLQLAHSN
jgi:hypothetical protein